MILRATVRGRPLLGTLPSGFFGCFVCSIVLLFVFLQCNEPQEGRAGAYPHTLLLGSLLRLNPSQHDGEFQAENLDNKDLHENRY